MSRLAARSLNLVTIMRFLLVSMFIGAIGLLVAILNLFTEVIGGIAWSVVLAISGLAIVTGCLYLRELFAQSVQREE